MSAAFAATSTSTAAALGRFHASDANTPFHSFRTENTGRQRSSSFTSKTSYTKNNTSSSFMGMTGSMTRPHSPSPAAAATATAGTSAYGGRKLSLANPSLIPKSLQDQEHSRPDLTESSFESTQKGPARINHIPTTAQNNGPPGGRHDTGMAAVCTGRSRSSTLTGADHGAAAVAAAALSTQLENVMRPRRPSIVSRVSGNLPGSSPLAYPPVASLEDRSEHYTAHTYPPQPLLPLLQSAAAPSRPMDEATPTSQTSNNSTHTSSAWSHTQVGFLPRILILVGLFGMSLGGLYLLAQVLPPLSLPKSIEDVKVDAAILQEFATATFEGWLRTFWVFSAVYMWKQCFGIPGSAFLNILAGALYGPWFGTLLTSALTTLGSVLAYFMSFFLMEPIMNRYASTRLDQMRHQIQKKTARSTKSKSLSLSTATSTAVETSVTGTRPQPASTSIVSAVHGPTTSMRGTLRTRSSSFTVRANGDGQENNDMAGYGYNASTLAPSQLQQYHHHHDEIETLETEGLLHEEGQEKFGLGHHDEMELQGLGRVLEEDGMVVNENSTTHMANKDQDDQEEEGTSLFMQLLLIRLFPLTPYWFINLASPLVGVPVIPFMTSMFLGCMPYNYICAQAGAILGEIHELRDIYQQPWIMVQIVFVLVLSLGATFATKRWTKKQQQTGQDPNKSRSSEEEGEEAGQRLLRGENEDEVEERADEENIPMQAMHSVATTDQPSRKRDSAIIDMSAYRY